MLTFARLHNNITLTQLGLNLYTMSNLTYINEKGAGTTNSDLFHYSQLVDLGAFVKLAGQGGWDNSGNLDYNEVEQVNLAFENVDRVLQAAGLRGWEDVYSVRSYHVNIGESFQPMVDKLKERIPGHKPIWTCIGVKDLALPTMKIEIEVEAKRA